MNKAKHLFLACIASMASLSAAIAGFVDPLIAPATASHLAAKGALTAVTRTPSGQWVSVGRRGHILLSANGKDWRQAVSVPVSSDLVGVFFITPRKGWAVGHGGVILITNDGGQHWEKQLDGRKAADLLVQFYESRAATEPNKADIEFLLRDARRFKESGPSRPFLDIWFENEMRGYAVGAYNLIFVTEDGGTTWLPRPHYIRNEMGLHLNTITAFGEDVYIAGEQGLFARLDRGTGQFERIATPYGGSFFGLTGKPGLLVLFGLQGNAFHSRDGGASWEKLESGLSATITSGAIMPDGRLILAGQDGRLAVSGDNGDHFTKITPPIPSPIFAIAPGSGNTVVAVGLHGAATLSLDEGIKNGK